MRMTSLTAPVVLAFALIFPPLIVTAEEDAGVVILTTEFAAQNEFASGWVGSYVYDAASGEAIGEIRDLVLAAEGSAISHAVMDVGASLGIGETLVVVPVSRIDIVKKAGQIRFHSDITKSELIEAATAE